MVLCEFASSAAYKFFVLTCGGKEDEVILQARWMGGHRAPGLVLNAKTNAAVRRGPPGLWRTSDWTTSRPGSELPASALASMGIRIVPAVILATFKKIYSTPRKGGSDQGLKHVRVAIATVLIR